MKGKPIRKNPTRFYQEDFLLVEKLKSWMKSKNVSESVLIKQALKEFFESRGH